jgi:hypothetical protein
MKMEETCSSETSADVQHGVIPQKIEVFISTATEDLKSYVAVKPFTLRKKMSIAVTARSKA